MRKNIDKICFLVRRTHDNMQTPYFSFLLKKATPSSLPIMDINKVPQNIKLDNKTDCMKYCLFYANNQLLDIDKEKDRISLDVFEKERLIIFFVETNAPKEKLQRGSKFFLLREIVQPKLPILPNTFTQQLVSSHFQAYFSLPQHPLLLYLIPNADTEDLDCLPVSKHDDEFFHFSREPIGKPYVVFANFYGCEESKKLTVDTCFLKDKVLVRDRSQIQFWTFA
jgi:hypothetical protein